MQALLTLHFQCLINYYSENSPFWYCMFSYFYFHPKIKLSCNPVCICIFIIRKVSLSIKCSVWDTKRKWMTLKLNKELCSLNGSMSIIALVTLLTDIINFFENLKWSFESFATGSWTYTWKPSHPKPVNVTLVCKVRVPKIVVCHQPLLPWQPESPFKFCLTAARFLVWSWALAFFCSPRTCVGCPVSPPKTCQ